MVNLISLGLGKLDILKFPKAVPVSPYNYVGHPMGLLLALTYSNVTS